MRICHRVSASLARTVNGVMPIFIGIHPELISQRIWLLWMSAFARMTNRINVSQFFWRQLS